MKIEINESEFYQIKFALGYTGNHTLHDKLEKLAKKYGR